MQRAFRVTVAARSFALYEENASFLEPLPLAVCDVIVAMLRSDIRKLMTHVEVWRNAVADELFVYSNLSLQSF